MTSVIPSQYHSSLLVINASHSIHLFKLSGGLSPLKVLYFSMTVNICNAQPIAWDILLELIFVAGNLYNKCPSGYSNKRAVLVILSMRSLVSIEQQSPRRPCDISTDAIEKKVYRTVSSVKFGTNLIYEHRISLLKSIISLNKRHVNKSEIRWLK